MKRQRWIGFLVTAAAVVVVCVYAAGRVRADGAPATQPLWYSGYLEQAGAPVDGTTGISIGLWDAESIGTEVCSQPNVATPVSRGRFRIALPTECVTAIHANAELWVAVVVNNTDYLPRTKIAAVPYALEADRASLAVGALDVRLKAIEVSGQVAFFNLPACPPGWSELTDARGRYLVGLPASGMLGKLVGTALADGENRPAGAHTHPITDPGHTHTFDINTGSGANPSGGSAGAGKANTGSSMTGITVQAPAGAVAGTNAPYLQLLACQRM